MAQMPSSVNGQDHGCGPAIRAILSGWLFAVMILLAGCASLPAPIVSSKGSPPSPGAIYVVDQTMENGPLGRSVIAGLVARGFRSSPDAAYLVQFTEGFLPGKVGLFVPPADRRQAPEWLASPSRSHGILGRRALLTFSSARSGEEVYRLSVTAFFRARKPLSDEQFAAVLFKEIERINLPMGGGM